MYSGACSKARTRSVILDIAAGYVDKYIVSGRCRLRLVADLDGCLFLLIFFVYIGDIDTASCGYLRNLKELA